LVTATEQLTPAMSKHTEDGTKDARTEDLSKYRAKLLM
jgi:hypothetical protein